MKKKIKIKSGGKVVLTLIILLISTFVYTKVGILGDLAQSHKGYLIVCIGAWLWLLVGQLLALSVIWEW